MTEQKQLKAFFDAYQDHYDTSHMDVEQALEWFDGDVVLGIVAETTGISEETFLNYVHQYFDLDKV